jgi:mono/diheme cytochrome c family protein
MKFFLTLLAATLGLPAANVGAAEKPPLPIHDLPDFTISRGQVLYQRYCLFCHGETGRGDGQNSFSLKTRPADLSQIVPDRNDEQLLDVIIQGGAEKNLSPAMPSFGHTLTEKQIRQLIIFLRNFPIKN